MSCGVCGQRERGRQPRPNLQLLAEIREQGPLGVEVRPPAVCLSSLLADMLCRVAVQFASEPGRRLTVASIEPGSKASRTAGLRPGLVLLSAQDMEASPGSDVRERVIRKLQTASRPLTLKFALRHPE